MCVCISIFFPEHTGVGGNCKRGWNGTLFYVTPLGRLFNQSPLIFTYLDRLSWTLFVWYFHFMAYYDVGSFVG